MKKWFLVVLLLKINTSIAQINYEHTYPFVNSLSMSKIQLADVGGNDFKYIYADYQTNDLKMFNLDHSVFLTIPIPVTLSNQGEYTIGYVTKSLFDCDTNMIEYAIMASQPLNNFYVYRQDGTLLFQRDSTIAPYGFGEFSGSYIVRPIVNTPAGAKLFLAKRDSAGFYTNVDVYSLCGSLPQNAPELVEYGESLVAVYPNPTNRQVYFDFNMDPNINNYEFIVFSSTGKTIEEKILLGTTNSFILDCSALRSGVYFYKLISQNNVIKAGKFIVAQ